MAYDRYVRVTEDGRIFYCVENDGWSYLRRGPELRETETTLEELKQNHPRLYENALIELKKLGDKKQRVPPYNGHPVR